MSFTPEEKKERLKSLGGSEAAAALGLSRWMTPLQLWAYKTETIEQEDGNELYKRLGTMMEPIVAQLFMEATGKKVHKVNETKYHKKYPFLSANIDRRVVGEDAFLECKTCSTWKAKEWEGEEIPREYLIQCVHYLAVTGDAYCYIAVLIGNEKLIWKRIERDDKLIADVVQKEVAFWAHVTSGEIPATITARDADTLYSLYPLSDPDKTVPLDDTANALIETRGALLEDKKVLITQLEKIDNEIKFLLKDSEIGQSDKWRVTWKSYKKESYTVSASEGRRLNIKELKNERKPG